MNTKLKPKNPFEIVNRAVQRSELDKLLLGAEDYRYRSDWSPATGTTDLTELLSVIYDKWPPDDRARVGDMLSSALYALVDRYDGLEPVATCILIESLRKARNRSPMNLPVFQLASKLKASIEHFEERLKLDRNGDGARWPDGWFGEFRRLSQNTIELGGPSFFG